MPLEKASSIVSMKFFNGIPEKEVMGVYNSMLQKRLKPKEILIKEGAPLNTLYLVVSGSLSVLRTIRGQQLVVNYLHSGDVYGYLGAEKEILSQATLAAEEPSSVITINNKSLILLKPDIKSRLLTNIANVLCASNQAIYSSVSALYDQKQQLLDTMRTAYEGRRQITEGSERLHNRLLKIPALPPYTHELSSMLLKENTSSDKIVDYIKTDPSLMALILKTVNSPFYNLSQKVSDFQHAVMLLGFGQIYQIVMDNSLNSIMPHRPEFIDIRDRALIISAIAFEIAMAAGFQRPLLLSTIGTLHVVGKAVLLLLKREQDFADCGDFLDDALIAARLLKEWKMPENIYSTISYYKYPYVAGPDVIPSSVLNIVSMLHAAEGCLEIILKCEPACRPFLEDYLKAAGLNDSISDITFKKVMPALRKRFDMLPKPVQMMLGEKI